MGEQELARSCPSVRGEPGRRGLSAARGTTPHPRAQDSWPVTCQGSGTTAVPTARAQTLIQDKVPTLCSEFQSVPHAAGKSQGQASRRHGWWRPPWTGADTGSSDGPPHGGGSEPGSLWAAQGAAAPSLPERRLESPPPSAASGTPVKAGKEP